MFNYDEPKRESIAQTFWWQ